MCIVLADVAKPLTMTSKLAQNAKAESVLSQTRGGSLVQRTQTMILADNAAIAGLNGLMNECRSLLSLVGATSTTLRSVGIIVALLVIVALGKTACFPSARIEASIGDTVQRINQVEHDVLSHSSDVSRNQDIPLCDSSVDLSDSDEETEPLDQLFHNLLPSSGPKHSLCLHHTLDQDQNHDVHLTGSQFGLDGLPNTKANIHMPSSWCFEAASFGDSSDAEPDGGLGPAQLDEIRRIADSYHNIDFEYTCGGPREDDSVSVASMAVLIDRDDQDVR
ncbi:hypothetical protein PG993_011522 [Apiospora rasikravindrae]|uniref:Uncharacterized protein n=1 Tax=Apiospora rasikravindrae TaxID=990691 RepID=A0ABR1SEF8_9PEZI